MPKLRNTRPVDANYPFDGPNATTMTQAINKPAEAVFASFEDGAAWKEWLGLEVEWTSPRPFGVGTTRTVVVNGQTIEEVFSLWEKPLRMGFYFSRTTLPLAAFAEDYTLTRTGETSCELSWSYAFEWGGPLPSVFGRMFGAFFKRQGQGSLKKLAAMMESTTRYDA